MTSYLNPCPSYSSENINAPVVDFSIHSFSSYVISSGFGICRVNVSNKCNDVFLNVPVLNILTSPFVASFSFFPPSINCLYYCLRNILRDKCPFANPASLKRYLKSLLS